MRVFLDACVLYPTVLREVLLAVAAEGLYQVLWSDRVLEEWQRAAARLGQGQDLIAGGEIALLRSKWPLALVTEVADLDLDLPDQNDVHVAAAAKSGNAERIVTLNLRDFPQRRLAPLGLRAEHPDAFLYGLWLQNPEKVAAAADAVRGEAERLSGQPQPIRKLLKRAYLSRLGKSLSV